METILRHEVGHVLGLDHPDVDSGLNFDTDGHDGNHIAIEPSEPCQGLQLNRKSYWQTIMVSHGKRNSRMHKLGYDDIAALYFLYPHPKRTKSRDLLPWEFLSTEKLESLVRARGLTPKTDRNLLLFQAKGDSKMRAWLEARKAASHALHEDTDTSFSREL